VNKNREMPVIDQRHIFLLHPFFPICIAYILVVQKASLHLTEWLGLLRYFPISLPNLCYKQNIFDNISI